MESLQEKLPTIMAWLVAIAMMAGILFFMENYEKTYYTQIDNSKIERVSTSDDMKYEYTLDCYDENGKKKELKFKTSRELRENAYLILKVRIIGVHNWEEVKYSELPEKVKVNYKE